MRFTYLSIDNSSSVDFVPAQDCGQHSSSYLHMMHQCLIEQKQATETDIVHDPDPEKFANLNFLKSP